MDTDTGETVETVDVSETVRAAEAALQAPDAIMEPNVLENVGTYIRAGNPPANAIFHLANTYRGHAQMANLLASWLILAGRSEDSVRELANESVFDVVVKNFDPKKADSLFSSASEPPAWIESMILSPLWRKLVYKLASEYPTCMMLNFAIKRIADLGFSREIAHESRLCTIHFSVYNKILGEILSDLLTCNEREFPEQLSVFTEMCTSTECAYLYAQVVLYNLMKEGNLRAYRVAEEMYRCATNEEHTHCAPFAKQLRVLFFQEVRPDTEQYFLLLKTIKQAVSMGRFETGDVVELYNEYYNPQRQPPIEYIRNNEVLETLTKQLFSVSSPPQSAVANKIIFLLSFAATYTGNYYLDERDCNELSTALSKVVRVVPRPTPASALREAIGTIAREDYVRKYPVIAAGVLEWTKNNLTDPDFYDESLADILFAMHLQFLEEIVAWHPLMRQRVFDLCSELYMVSLSKDRAMYVEQLKKRSINIFVLLSLFGFITPVLNRISSWSSERLLDYSHIRLFFELLFNGIDPPFQPVFVTDIIRTLDMKGIYEAFKDSSTKAYASVVSFLDICDDPGTYGLGEEEDVPLDDKTKDHLETLQRFFSLKD